MPTNQQGSRADYLAVQDFIHARMEIEFARHESRAATVRLDEAAALGERIARTMGGDAVAELDAYVGTCVQRALGHRLPEGGEDDIREVRKDLAEDFGESTFALMAQYIDLQIKLHVKKAENRGDGLHRVTLPATVTAQTRSTEPADEGVPLRSYRFVWREGGSYARGDVVTHGGAPWICLTRSCDRPGTSKAWKLIGKSSASGPKAEPRP